MANIEIKSFNQILGSMVRKIIAETPLSDVNAGSVFLSLLEACASNDFENNVAILNVLELLSVDSVRNNDLDNKAADLKLARKAATVASGVVTIYNTNITKQSSSLYSLKPAPIAGQTVLFVTDTEGWDASGTLYIGRGTNSFEGPIAYSSITTFATYSQINLSAALQKDHLSSDTVINAQGQPDRVISAGTVVKIPSNNQSAEVVYSTLRDAVIPAGEDKVENVLVVADVAGTQGNALINTIRQFDSVPFVGATVSNTQAFTSGTDIETDVQLRNRIKSYAASLARGTSPAILSAVIGLSDPDENKRVVSAVLSQPVSVGAPSILYVDDGSGFQPSYAGQAVDVLLASANGTEEFLQLSNYPLPRPQVTNIAIGPFSMTDQMFLNVIVDGEEDTVVFETSDFVNIAVATTSEIVAAINDKATLFKARLDNDSSNILLYPVDPDAEFMQVVALRTTEDSDLYANNILNFPTKEVSYIALYQNSSRLTQRAQSASVQTVPFAAWNLLAAGNLILSVDGTPAQNGAFTLSDFDVTSFAALGLENWVDAFNAKFAGITAEATPGQTMKITSNKSGSAASVEILGGTYQAAMFSTNDQEAVGQESQFEINRQTGQIRILTDIDSGDTISAGVTDAKGFVVSTSTASGLLNFDYDSVGRESQMVVVVDAAECERLSLGLQLSDVLTISDAGSSRMRIMAPNAEVFANVQPDNFIFIAERAAGWFSTANTGLFKVIKRGDHLTDGVDTFIEVHNNNTVGESGTVLDVADVTAFKTDVYPQLWRASTLSSPVSTTLTELVDSLNDNIQGARASIFRTNSVKLTSSTEEGGSIAIPVCIGNAASIFTATTSVEANNEPLVANKTPDKDLVGFPRMWPITSQNTFLDRAVYPLVHGSISADADQDPSPYTGTYAEEVEVDGVIDDSDVGYSDLIAFTKGCNEGVIRPIKAFTATDTVGTQQGTPRTLFNHVVDDEVTVFQSLKLSADDNIVCVMNGDASVNTIDINAARTAQVNSGSNSLSFAPTTTEFSADDSDNEAGVDFGTVSVWGTALNDTDFSDYAILMRARNWYSSGGTAASNGKFIVRSAEYGTNGEKMRFSIKYPGVPDQDETTVLVETPSYNTLSYYFGSGPARATAIPASTVVTVTGPYPDTSTNFPAGAGSSGNYWDLSFAAGTFSAVIVGDVLSGLSGSGLGSSLLNQFAVQAKSGSVFRIYNRSGVAGAQTISNPALVHFFPLQATSVADIIAAINDSDILVAAAVGSSSATIVRSTYEDQYTYGSNATALAYGHNPGTLAVQDHVKLYDGINWVKSFQNANPNFTTKVAFTLPSSGVSSSIYAMNTAPNEDATTGEYVKLVPTTIKNVQHHLTQKAMSQLPILSEVKVADAGKRIQIVSKELGSAGGVAILGGNANLAQTDVIGETQVASDASGSYLLATVSAFPNTFSVGDMVKVQNQMGVRRQSRLASTDTVDVYADGSGVVRYYWMPKDIGFTSATTITITDVSSSYSDYNGDPLAAGTVFRWTHSAAGAESLADVVAGDLVHAFGTMAGWSQGNLAKLPLDGAVTGLPIINVNEASRYFDVVCPFGKTMSATAISATGNIHITPSPRIRWNLPHMAPVVVDGMTRASNVMTVTCAKDHMLNTGDSVVIRDSGLVADGTYGPITTTSDVGFTFANAGSNATEADASVTIRNSAYAQTTYRIEPLGLNNMVRLSHAGGASPKFASMGVAVDDYVVISGTTFNSLNSGTFRVIAADDTSVVFENSTAIAESTTLVPFNNIGLTVTWTANSDVVTGAAGAFKNLSDGLWVKKQEDDVARYLQVTGCDTSDYTTATQITLGGSYSGISGTSAGISFDQMSALDGGVLLQDVSDLAFYEGDSALEGDALFVQNITNANWFSAENCGSFAIESMGSDENDHYPYVEVTNDAGESETARAMSVNTLGFYIVEADPFYSYRQLSNVTISDSNSLQRSLYMLPDSRSEKFSEANSTYITHTSKLGFNLNAATGTDGYNYYTGLLRRVQRTVDGFSPDPVNFPERRAVGSRIETLPPLIRDIVMVLTITTNQGSAVQDISGNVKSAIIDYVNNLGVGEDVILSAVIAKIMQVRGVAAVTFNVPAATEERVSIDSNEKAIITADNIGIN